MTIYFHYDMKLSNYVLTKICLKNENSAVISMEKKTKEKKSKEKE